MDENAREQFESALQTLVQNSEDRATAVDAVNDLEEAMKNILSARDEEWKEYIKEQELSTSEVDEENVNLAVKRLLDNVDTLLERALNLEQRLSSVRDEIVDSLQETGEEQQIREDIQRLRNQFNDLREDVEGTLHGGQQEKETTPQTPSQREPPSSGVEQPSKKPAGQEPPPPPPPSSQNTAEEPVDTEPPSPVEETVEQHIEQE